MAAAFETANKLSEIEPNWTKLSQISAIGFIVRAVGWRRKEKLKWNIVARRRKNFLKRPQFGIYREDL